jgi:hypothetical protein
MHIGKHIATCDHKEVNMIDYEGNPYCCESFAMLCQTETDGIDVDALGNVSEVDAYYCEEHSSKPRDDLKFKCCPYCKKEL